MPIDNGRDLEPFVELFVAIEEALEPDAHRRTVPRVLQPRLGSQNSQGEEVEARQSDRLTRQSEHVLEQHLRTRHHACVDKTVKARQSELLTRQSEPLTRLSDLLTRQSEKDKQSC